VPLEIQKELVAEKRHETDFLSNGKKAKWIEDYVERETARARKQVEDTVAAVQQEQDDMTRDEIAQVTARDPGKTFEAMLVATTESLSDLASSGDGEDGEDEDDEETEQGKQSEDDEPGWVMGTITKTVQQRTERLRQ
jgi:DNA-directed RNA polymerase specialized sigma subunit